MKTSLIQIVFANLILLGRWLLKWIFIMLFIGLFVICSISIGKLIDNRIWIIFLSDLVFCFLFWRFLRLSKYSSYRSHLSHNQIRRAVLLIVLMVVSVVLIFMASLGVGMNKAPFMIINIFLFPIMFVVTLAIYSYHSYKKRFKPNIW